MKPKFSFFMITHFTDCGSSWISISQPPQGHHPPRLLLHFFTVSPTRALTLPAPKISPPSAVPAIPSDGKYKQADYLQKYKKCKSTCIFLRVREGRLIQVCLFYPDNISLSHNLWQSKESLKSLLFCQIQLQVGNQLKKVLT